MVSIVWRSVRVCFWFCFNSVMLHFLYFQVKCDASLLTSECSTNFSSYHVHHCVTGERETDTERDRERQTETQSETQTGRQRQGNTDRDRETDRQTSRERESYILHVLRLTLNVMQCSSATSTGCKLLGTTTFRSEICPRISPLLSICHAKWSVWLPKSAGHRRDSS